jgi:transcription elongation factor GreB
MSKAFTTENSGDEPVIVPPRAPLPPGVPNYVTARGMELLKREREGLVAERTLLNAMPADSEERRRRHALVNGRLRDLTNRIATARIVAPRLGTDKTVRFGARVTLRTINGDAPGTERRIQLVGVDEAGESASLVAFCAPVAAAILGHRAGEQVASPAGRGDEVLEIVDVEY